MNKVRSKDSKIFSGRNRKFKRFFRAKTGNLQKKRFLSRKCHEIRCHSTKNTNLGLDLHSSSTEPVNFFGAQSSLGGAQAVIWGGTAPVCPPWCRIWVRLYGFLYRLTFHPLNSKILEYQWDFFITASLLFTFIFTNLLSIRWDVTYATTYRLVIQLNKNVKNYCWVLDGQPKNWKILVQNAATNSLFLISRQQLLIGCFTQLVNRVRIILWPLMPKYPCWALPNPL